MIYVALTILLFSGRLGPGPLILTGVYLALVVAVFFLPLGSTHEAMREAKQEELRVIAHHFNREYDQVKLALLKGDDQPGPAIGDSFSRLEHLRRIYDEADSMPVWPFDTRTLLRFGTTLGIPVGLMLLNVALGRFG